MPEELMCSALSLNLTRTDRYGTNKKGPATEAASPFEEMGIVWEGVTSARLPDRRQRHT